MSQKASKTMKLFLITRLERASCQSVMPYLVCFATRELKPKSAGNFSITKLLLKWALFPMETLSTA